MKSYTVKSVNGEIADKHGAVIIDVSGNALSGTSTQRELATSTPVGVGFWDTDLKIPCYLEAGIWYNAAGGVIPSAPIDTL